MEDDNRSFATETLDEALVKKHHDMLQRFSARHHARKSDSPHSSSSTFESISSFLSRFADSKRSTDSIALKISGPALNDRVRSRLIIEDSNGVRFAPYCLDYGGIEEDLKMAGLEEETESWANVDDFLWLRAVQSPNWSNKQLQALLIMPIVMDCAIPIVSKLAKD
ncbi:hypothetical protein HID58_030244 [Brassica napus]|uniref:C-CAP/cofactor C-like domain-containing protein n=1 Tax=Brassica napus TaxID=3708 RepID=A0ABQ8CFE9_BRANA|nr:hypothetical protein HID58_030244 [Brassica napus]